MDFDRTTPVDNEYKRNLSEQLERIRQEKDALEQRKEKAHEIGELLIAKDHERHDLEKELFKLANQGASFSSQQPAGLRDVNGAADKPRVENSVSWDFEGLDMKDENKPEYEEFMVKLIAKLDEEINAKEVNLELIQKQMAGEAGKSSNEVPRGYNAEHLQNGIMAEKMKLVTAGGEDISLSPTTKVRELERLNHELQKQIEELLENSKQQENQINVLFKQKEELLQVNHQWDEQYRLQKADKERLAAELRKRTGQSRENSQVQRQSADVPADKETTKLVQELTKRNDELHEQVVKLTKEQKERDQLWTAAKKMINQERAAKETITQMKLAADERIKQLEAELVAEKQSHIFLKKEVERLSPLGGPDNSANVSMGPSSNVAEQIEMLKQQISVYADDFASERSDRERIQADRETQKERIKEFEKEIALLKEQVRVYRDDFDKERRDKERLQRHLRERSSQVKKEDPWYLVPPGEYISMNPPQRRQPMYHDRQRAYSPREIQEMAFQQQQQPHHFRGQVGGGHPGGLCHGCEADCDVIDGPAILKCPRCERVFTSNEREAFEDHIDKCTT